MNDVVLTFNLENSNPEKTLGFRVWLDQQKVFDNPHVAQLETVTISLSDQEAQHVLELELYGKHQQHTILDDNGKIIEDAVLTISNFNVDDIEIENHMLGTYTHNFNGTAPQTTETFFGHMGCNGRVVIEFQTPIYLWLLEKM